METTGLNRIYTIGEIVYDIMFKDGNPVAAKPGGSMLNSAISLGRSGVPVSFIGTCGNDKIGGLISSFLNENNVGTSYLHRENSQSIIALAFLDDKNNATYSFYKGNKSPDHPPLPDPGPSDALLFGSFFSISDPTRESAINLRNNASASGALIMYDPNFRESHLPDLHHVNSFIEDNVAGSQIVRGSNEDFEIIFGTGSAGSTWSLPCFKETCALIYTRSSEGVDLITRSFKKHYRVPSIRPVSTIGAGDSFNAGILAAMYQSGITRRDLPDIEESQWDKIIENGIGFSSAVCMSYDNYIPDP